jgi:hypothetical protein
VRRRVAGQCVGRLLRPSRPLGRIDMEGVARASITAGRSAYAVARSVDVRGESARSATDATTAPATNSRDHRLMASPPGGRILHPRPRQSDSAPKPPTLDVGRWALVVEDLEVVQFGSWKLG